jgi:Protein of unknown function (DUF3109)
MIIIQNTLVSEDLLDEQFVCDLNACKGACCIEGDSGAPLELDETDHLEATWEAVQPYMRKEGIRAIEEKGMWQVDSDNDLVTTLVGQRGECSYVYFDNHGIAKCALEKAYLEGKTNWRKPLSCHLYPVRLAQLTDFIGVNYHRWQLCEPACECGSRLKVPVFRFLKEPLIRKFGTEWYEELEKVFEVRKEENL